MKVNAGSTGDGKEELEPRGDLTFSDSIGERPESSTKKFTATGAKLALHWRPKSPFRPAACFQDSERIGLDFLLWSARLNVRTTQGHPCKTLLVTA